MARNPKPGTRSPQIRVLHLSSSEVFGGNEEHLRVCAGYADPDALKISVACPEGDFSGVLQNERISWFPLSMKSKFSLACAFQIAKIVNENHIDIVHSHNRRTDYFSYLSSFFCKPRAFVTTVHDRVSVGNALPVFLHARLLRSFFTRVFCVSKKSREQVIAFAQCPPEKVFAVTNGTDLNKMNIAIDKASKKKELGLPVDKKIVGMMARMRDANFGKKAHPVFLRAAADVLKKGNNVLFAVAGEEEKPRRELLKLSETLGIKNHVIFLGPRKKDSLEVLSCYDVFVLPSSYEGLPRTLSEAMGLGKAVVATNVDGVPELVTHGDSGLLVPPDAPEKMSEAILSYLEDEGKVNQFGARAKEHIFSNFGHEGMVKQFESHYFEALKFPVKENVHELPHLLHQ